jgi:hypothetical protein
MHIRGVAKKIGLSPDAIRFYERTALLPRPSRTGNMSIPTWRLSDSFAKRRDWGSRSRKFAIFWRCVATASNLAPLPCLLAAEKTDSGPPKAQRPPNIAMQAANRAALLQEGAAPEKCPLPALEQV